MESRHPVGPPEKEPLLIVEDNAIVGAVLEKVLGRHCEVTLVTSVAAGLSALRFGTYTIVLSDFFLPDGDGKEVLRSASELQPRALRLLMSGRDLEEVESSSREGFIDGWFPKPFSNEKFVRVIRSIPRWGRPFGDAP